MQTQKTRLLRQEESLFRQSFPSCGSTFSPEVQEGIQTSPRGLVKAPGADVNVHDDGQEVLGDGVGCCRPAGGGGTTEG